jgi:hypothetical protein
LPTLALAGPSEDGAPDLMQRIVEPSPEHPVVVWFDSGFEESGPRAVIAAFRALGEDEQPYRVHFPGGGASYASPIRESFQAYGFDPGPVIHNGLPDEEALSKIGAELFDLFAAWAGLRYVRDNRHRGNVLMVGDGTGAIEFMQGKCNLDLTRFGVDAAGMKGLIEDLAQEIGVVEWMYQPEKENPAVERMIRRQKDFLRTRRSGAEAESG